MNDDSSSGGRGPSSIKPPTIKPPTLHDEQFGATSLGGVPEPASYRSAPAGQIASPAYAAAPPAPRKQNLWLWIVAGGLLLGLLIIVLAVVVLLLLR